MPRDGYSGQSWDRAATTASPALRVPRQAGPDGRRTRVDTPPPDQDSDWDGPFLPPDDEPLGWDGPLLPSNDEPPGWDAPVSLDGDRPGPNDPPHTEPPRHPYPDPDRDQPADGTAALPQLRPAPPAEPAAPPTAPPGAPPLADPGSSRPNRRRWWLAAVLIIAVAAGATAAVLADRDDRDTASPPAQVGPGGAPQTAGQGSPTPSGIAGLGANPSASASGTPPAGFQPFPAPRKTLPGASLHIQGGETFSDALRRSDSTFGPLRMVRVFYPGLPPSWSGSRADVSNRTVVVSFKAAPRDITAGKHDSKLVSWFRSVPRNVDVYWSYFHEPENDVQRGSYTPAQFAAAFRHVSALADQARNPRLRATLILMCWTLAPASGRNFDAYYPGSAAVDVLGWDCYNSGADKNKYTAPEQVFSRMINKSRALGKPWGLAETGSIRVAGDSGGTGRAAWIRSMSKYLNEQRPVWVAYYDYQVAGGDYRLTDSPSRQAWKAWCSAAPS